MHRLRPRHREHQVYRDAESLRTMYVSETRRICDYGIGNEWDGREGIWLYTRPPATVKHLGDHFPLLLNVACPQTLHAWNKARISDHVCHQFRGVTSYREKLEPGFSHKSVENIVRREAHSMPMRLKLVPQCDKRLYISTTADDLYDDIELVRKRRRMCCLEFGIRRGRAKIVFSIFETV